VEPPLPHPTPLSQRHTPHIPRYPRCCQVRTACHGLSASAESVRHVDEVAANDCQHRTMSNPRDLDAADLSSPEQQLQCLHGQSRHTGRQLSRSRPLTAQRYHGTTMLVSALPNEMKNMHARVGSLKLDLAIGCIQMGRTVQIRRAVVGEGCQLHPEPKPFVDLQSYHQSQWSLSSPFSSSPPWDSILNRSSSSRHRLFRTHDRPSQRETRRLKEWPPLAAT